MTRIRHVVAGLLAAALALATAELAAGLLPGGRSPISAVADRIIALTPGPIVRSAIETFGDRNRLVLLVAFTMVAALAGAAIGVAAAQRRWVGAVGLGAFGALGVAACVVDPLIPATPAVLAPTIGALVGFGGLVMLLNAAASVHTATELAPATAASTARSGAGHPDPSGRPAGDRDDGRGRSLMASVDPTNPPPPGRSRREFLVVAMAAAGAAATSGIVGRTIQNRNVTAAAREGLRLPTPSDPVGAVPASAQLDVAGISPLITPNDDFFRIDTAFSVPRVDPATHTIRITGRVDRPFEISYDELLQLADTESYVTLSCVSNEVGGGLVGHARWLGVPLADLLERAGVQDGADQIVGRSVDGWTGGFPVEAATDGRTALLAVGMNGEPLPPQHGFPVRLVVAGLYGYVCNTKWLSEIELTTFDDYDAYWIPRGWGRFGPIKTQSRIDVPESGATFGPGEVVLAGVAWADENGVSGVQVSVDGGAWDDAEVADELSATSWRQWRYVWQATESGEHLVRVRALDADGTPQTAEEAPPAPDGATGHHTIRIAVA